MFISYGSVYVPLHIFFIFYFGNIDFKLGKIDFTLGEKNEINLG